LIIDGFYITAKTGTAANTYGIQVQTAATNVEIVIRNCMVNGKGGFYGGIKAGYPYNTNFICNKVFNCLRSGITYNVNSQANFFPQQTVNNTIYNCDSGIVAGGTGTSRMLYKNNICVSNLAGDFLRPLNSVGCYNVCSDVSGADSLWKTGSAAGYSNNNLKSKTWDSMFVSADTLDTNFLRLLPAKRGGGVYVNHPWFNRYINDVPVCDSAIDQGSYGFNRNAAIDTANNFRRSIIQWPAYGNLVARLSIKKANPGWNNILFKNLVGDTLPMYIDSIYGTDSAIVYVRSKRYPAYYDSIFMYYGPGVYSNSDKNRVYAGIGFGMEKTKRDSAWCFHNMVNGDVAITTDTGKYEAWPGFAYSLDKTKAYFAFCSHATNTHGYDSTGYLRLIVRSVDTNGIIGAVIKDTAISKSYEPSNRDWRDPQISVFNLNGTELVMINTYAFAIGVTHNLYAIYSTDGWNTISAVKMSNGKSLCSRSKIQRLSNDSLFTMGYDYNTMGKKCSVWVSKAHINNFNDSADWVTSLAFASPIVGGTDSVGLNETQGIELKTGNKFSGRMVCLSRSETATTQTTWLSYSSDYGQTWTAPATAFSYAVPTVSVAARYPWDINRLSDGKTILAFGGALTSGNGGHGFITDDEFSTFYQLPRTWVQGYNNGNGRLYPSFSEYKNKRIGLAWCTNADPGQSEVYFNYYNLNGQLTLFDTMYTNGWLTGYKPRVKSDSGFVFGKAVAGQNGVSGQLFAQYNSTGQQGPYIYHGAGNIYNTAYSTPKQLSFRGIFNSKVSNFGILKDSTVYGSLRTYNFIKETNGIDFRFDVDSIYIAKGNDKFGTKLNHDTTTYSNYRVTINIDSVNVYRNDTLLLAKTSALPDWDGKLTINTPDTNAVAYVDKLTFAPLYTGTTADVYDTVSIISISTKKRTSFGWNWSGFRF
jgi:hypothetical protein